VKRTKVLCTDLSDSVDADFAFVDHGAEVSLASAVDVLAAAAWSTSGGGTPAPPGDVSE
jgi:hypothetical protein